MNGEGVNCEFAFRTWEECMIVAETDLAGLIVGERRSRRATISLSEIYFEITIPTL